MEWNRTKVISLIHLKVLQTEMFSNLSMRYSPLEFFVNEEELSLNSVNSGKLINHSSMNWVQFKNPVSHACLALW